MNAPLLQLQAVSQHFAAGESRIAVLDDISLDVGEGEIVALLGRSGCGKSTLLRIVSGLTPASSGRVLYKGRTVTRPRPRISMVFRIFALFPWLDVPTTETLGNDLLDLWLERQIPTRAIVMVSHSIEEALLLADRVVILDSNPDRIKRDPRVARAIRGTATATPAAPARTRSMRR